MLCLTIYVLLLFMYFYVIYETFFPQTITNIKLLREVCSVCTNEIVCDLSDLKTISRDETGLVIK